MSETSRPSQANTPMLDAAEEDPDLQELSARRGEAERDEDGVQRAPADIGDAPVDPDEPTNPAP